VYKMKVNQLVIMSACFILAASCVLFLFPKEGDVYDPTIWKPIKTEHDHQCISKTEFAALVLEAISRNNNIVHFHYPKCAGTHVYSTLKTAGVLDNDASCCNFETFLKDAISCKIGGKIFSYELYDWMLDDEFYRCAATSLFVVPIRDPHELLHSKIRQECRLISDKRQIRGATQLITDECASCIGNSITETKWGLLDGYRSSNRAIGKRLFDQNAIFMDSNEVDFMLEVVLKQVGHVHNNKKPMISSTNQIFSNTAREGECEQYEISKANIDRYNEDNTQLQALWDSLQHCKANGKDMMMAIRVNNNTSHEG
jgi:hypothetical protein